MREAMMGPSLPFQRKTARQKSTRAGQDDVRPQHARNRSHPARTSSPLEGQLPRCPRLSNERPTGQTGACPSSFRGWTRFDRRTRDHRRGNIHVARVWPSMLNQKRRIQIKTASELFRIPLPMGDVSPVSSIHTTPKYQRLNHAFFNRVRSVPQPSSTH